MKPFALVSLLCALAVFSVESSAQTILSATPSSSTSSQISMYSFGGVDGAYYRNSNLYLLYPYYAGTTNGNTYAEGKPYVRLYVYIQNTGSYLVNFNASAGTARMRHQSSGPVFDLSGKCATSGRCDYQLPLNLNAGGHYLYFWPTDYYKYVYSASVTSVATSNYTLSSPSTTLSN